ncbi:PSP1 domain-containing protein [Phaeodactylibacter xiamenensis]|uniref:PSP1 domain-containing protein n=1 Tax=Phaeodactylibacter xiamenensis TaxID=1524460 RepID=UPI003CCC4433
MGCTGCTTCGTGTPNGCKSNGGCATGGCNRLNTYDWLSSMDVVDTDPFDIVEVSFKNGAHKGFYRNQDHTRSITGDDVVVETGTGLDVGRITLSGELVRLQMKKKKTSEKDVLHKIIRKANERDLERLAEARSLEMTTMVRARAIARNLKLDMKIGDVEYQGDKRKATFYYTADGRVDFRELIRHYAKEFRVKIEMRQIGARQESARIGGLGSCGRELCCSTWLTDFKSVTTAAARYQNLAINQSKLSGMCGRLKCCLNYELDTYLDALQQFPKNADKLQTEAGTAILVKTDIFKGLMYYAYQKDSGRGKLYTLEASRVKDIKAMNRKGEKPADLVSLQVIFEADSEEEVDMGFEDVTGVIELPEEKRSKKRRKNKKKPGNRGKGGNSTSRGSNNSQAQNKSSQDKGSNSSGKKGDDKGSQDNKKGDGKSRSRNRRRKGGRGRGNNNNNGNKGDGDKS